MFFNSLPACFERFNAACPWDHDTLYHCWILGQLPRRFDRAPDVGSGSGDLARLLSGRVDAVQAVDSDPVITAQAHKPTPSGLLVTLTAADAPAGLLQVFLAVLVKSMLGVWTHMK
ncbi:hypothetical protein [Streptomyces triticiradicis]|uniref:hypothetical protein n=1 Tax=Streptomyces triticiradicis TaxID=2651189 RepID=UPI00298DC122|nr:hypothetical protein [Streptomyces triticiradicis]